MFKIELLIRFDNVKFRINWKIWIDLINVIRKFRIDPIIFINFTSPILFSIFVLCQ